MYKWRPIYHTPEYLKVINQANKVTIKTVASYYLDKYTFALAWKLSFSILDTLETA